MSKLLSRDILPELLRLGESFRKAVRSELLRCDAETLLSKTECGHGKWTGGFSVINVTTAITQKEATKLFYGENTETLQGHNDSKGVHTMSKVSSQRILDELVQLEERFREATRRELSECDLETILFEANRGQEKWTDDFYSIMNVTMAITQKEAIELYYGQIKTPRYHKNFMGS